VSPQPAEEDQVLTAGQVLVDRGELSGHAHTAAHLVGFGHDVVAEHPAVPASGRSRVASIRIAVVLPAPLGPRTP
jgi:hypothetical protein